MEGSESPSSVMDRLPLAIPELLGANKIVTFSEAPGANTIGR